MQWSKNPGASEVKTGGDPSTIQSSGASDQLPGQRSTPLDEWRSETTTSFCRSVATPSARRFAPRAGGQSTATEICNAPPGISFADEEALRRVRLPEYSSGPIQRSTTNRVVDITFFTEDAVLPLRLPPNVTTVVDDMTRPDGRLHTLFRGRRLRARPHPAVHSHYRYGSRRSSNHLRAMGRCSGRRATALPLPANPTPTSTSSLI